MSESTNSGAINDSNQAAPDSNTEAKFVNREAYENVSKDMHKYKSKVKDTEAKLAQLEADLKAKEEAELAKTQQFQKLWEDERKKRSELEAQLSETQKRQVENAKKSALKSALGNVKDEYLSFANLGSIELNEDGSPNPDSVHKTANEFRAMHPQLIVPSNKTDITSKAAPIDSQVTGQVDLSKMTFDEKVAYLTKLKTQNKR